jgi:cell fate regulator YaaT (PSP1 superfamily)
MFYFSPEGHKVSEGQPIVVVTSQGQRYGVCSKGNHEVDDARVVQPLRPVLRLATEYDTKAWEELRDKAAQAIPQCRKKIEEHGLGMKLISAEYTLDESKLIFSFTADGRVDFRELVRDLASLFRIRIELRQVGVRDETRILGGLGICGRPFCCESFLDTFQTVSIKMAKDQNISINPAKISGTCGRLLCCLKYEQDAYEALAREAPAVDSFVSSPEGRGRVLDVHLLSGRVKVLLDNQGEHVVKMFHKDDLQYKRQAAAEDGPEPSQKEGRRESKPQGQNRRPLPSPATAHPSGSVASEPPEIPQPMPGLPVREFGKKSQPHKCGGCGSCGGCGGSKEDVVASEEETVAKATGRPPWRGKRRR